ncbi:hypothetical protein GGR22_000728 [Flavobacterium gossypii]|uniref:Uncharacterized protein n=1 Tax=Flavobacterium gossypii TaxID=1646119 RepID=A0ABR6DLN8_9FLAO|nr:hypothetical protein [Flavobacterium gossypii]MBA9072602.1 hypothetical protein [Flavobacterium gossypii]
MSNLKFNIGKRGTVINRTIIDGEQIEEYIQGKLKSVENSTVVILQYVPYIAFLQGGEYVTVERVLELANLDFKGHIWK